MKIALSVAVLSVALVGVWLSIRSHRSGWNRVIAQRGAPRSDPAKAWLSFRRPARSPFQVALRKARQWRMRAHAAVGWERGADLQRDQSGQLQRAREEALRAAARARTGREQFQAALLLTIIEHEAGHHAAELRQARRLMALAPRDRDALSMQLQAARCNGLPQLVRQTDTALTALQRSAEARPAPAPDLLVPGDANLD